MATIDQKIEAIKEKLRKAEEQKRALEAKKKAAESKKTRAQETRKKILAGSAAIDLMAKDQNFQKVMTEKLSSFLTRSDDRALFDLPVVDS
jgi:uncharacterized protein (DUF3084 family)